MRCRQIVFGILMPMTLVAGPADAAVTVAFVDPGSFTDIGDLERDPRQPLLAIERYLKSLGDHYLSPQDVLRIEVLNILLAGRPRLPWHANSGVRIMTGEADWPRIELRYTFDSDGTTSKPVDETVVDMEYLRRLGPRYAYASLPYEKRMLDEWFKARFADRSRDKASISAAAAGDRHARTSAQTDR